MTPSKGRAWLARLPSEWGVRPLRHSVRCLDGRRIPLNAEQRGEIPGKIPYWGANGIVDYVDRFLFHEELVLLGEDGAPFFDANKPVAFHVREPVWVNNHIHVLRPTEDICARFLTHCLNAADYREFIEGSTRDKLTQSRMNEILLPFPERDVQVQVADFLDRKTAAIDALIAKKERLIELLEEKRQALITQAVTKGLDPNVPMKDSGIEWLGKIPAHWNVAALRWISDGLVTGTTPASDGAEGFSVEDTVPWYTPSSFSENDLAIGPPTRTLPSRTVLSGEARLFPAGSVLVTCIGNVGRTSSIAQAGSANQQITAIRVNRATSDSQYLTLVMRALQRVLAQHATATTLAILNQRALGSIAVPSPPLREQRAISILLSKQFERTKHLVSRIADSVTALREYRQGLITAAVTGQVDVSEAS